MDIFFGKMGITDLKYKPAYNPCMSLLPLVIYLLSGELVMLFLKLLHVFSAAEHF